MFAYVPTLNKWYRAEFRDIKYRKVAKKAILYVKRFLVIKYTKKIIIVDIASRTALNAKSPPIL